MSDKQRAGKSSPKLKRSGRANNKARYLRQSARTLKNKQRRGGGTTVRPKAGRNKGRRSA